ncbi:MFS transporter [bacterium 210820-DFI.6.37]|nr:MFS transporter [bacterium 210820-DFI.6.37]
MKKQLNIEYASIHAAYWMFYGVISSFASVFLLAQNYSNSQIGMILAAANILAVVLQPLAADLADRSARFSLIGITQILTILMMILTVGMFVLKGKSSALSMVFILLIAWHTVLHPLFNSLNFRLRESGIHINFGAARSMGSLAYSILVAILGSLVEKYGVQVLPISGELVLILLLTSLVFIKRHFVKARELFASDGEAAAKREPKKNAEGTEQTINLFQFVKRNRIFFVMNIGVIGLYFSNSILNNYMMQIVADVGGSSQDMGRILSLMAFLEIPTLVLFDWLHKKLSYPLMLKIASIGYTVKIVMCFLAKSVAMIFAAQFLQLASFALFLPAMVHYIDEIMSKGEAVKGQALFTTMITVTTVLSSLTGGVILDHYGAKTLTLTASAATAAGSVLVIAAVDRAGKKG